jgi:ubiquinone/menaquinone biosynthesis C-methylase UbiE
MQPEQLNEFFEANRDGWNKRTAIHKSSGFYDVASFKAGRTSLNNIELEELGDVKGKSLLHLQCHFGMDTLSWAREGAIVTGIDLSDEAIDYAKQLSVETNIPAKFISCNIYDLKDHLDEKFDVVFTSYGVIGWLPDLDKWASLISYFLKPAGIFYIIEFHPVVWMMDENFEQVRYPYHNVETITQHSRGTYADPSADIHYTEHTWNHSLSEVITSLLNHQMQLEHFKEYPFSSYNCFNNMVQEQDGYWRVKGLENKIPMMFSVKASRQVP